MSVAAPGPVVIHLVPHTHWDREWYEPFQVFRMRLVDLIDQLLARMADDPRLRFTLDGQAATIDDYLEVRPDAEPLIRRLIAEGRLAIGPWQILLDEFLVSGETIVRNLELGWHAAEQLGAPMPVGYLPDMFGHVAQMPQILRRAGIRNAVVWRGVPAAVDRNAFRWRSPDGSEVRAEYLVGGYGNGAYLLAIPDRLGEKVARYVAASRTFYGDRSILAMYGTDHAVPSPRLAEIVAGVHDAQPAGGVEIRIETLADYIAGAEPLDATGPAWTGELRSAARANMLSNVTSARIDLKMAAARAERALERYAEPLAALHGGPWPARLLELAWRKVVDNSAHDSICGCSQDAVVDQVLSRFAEAEQIGRGLAAAAIRPLAAATPRGQAVVVNPSPHERVDLVELDLDVPAPWAAVDLELADGRRVPTQLLDRPETILRRLSLTGRQVPELFARRLHGRELFGRSLDGHRIDRSGPVPRLTIVVDDPAAPPNFDVDAILDAVAAAVANAPDESWEVVVERGDRRRLAALVPAPGLGAATVRAVEAAGAETTTAPVVAAGRAIGNGLVRVEVADDGSLTIEGGGVRLERAGRLVDGGDYGDTYNYGPPAEDRLIERPSVVEVAAVESGPVRGRLAVVSRYDWPLGLLAGGAGRAETTAPVEVTTTIEIRAGEPFARFRIAFTNPSRDHRVRWHLPLPAAADRSAAEGQFGVAERGLTVEAGHGEVPIATMPAASFVHAAGATILLDHVTEYELVDGREIALTVLRSTGLISRNDNPFREDPAGPEVPVPDAQLLGPWAFTFAVLPHAGSWETAGVLGAAEAYRHPFLTAGGTGARGLTPLSPPPGLTIDGHGVVLSALGRRDSWLEVRLVATTDRLTVARIEGRPIRDAHDADLLGRRLGDLHAEPDGLAVPLGPWEIRTIRFITG